ncbi:VPLPA-CTERM sorting domain-containing protein [Litoreibacter roseus]|uniref:VPLPA-CTERM protein sorting domain-containing protein n=1 Tax=Litoreibacter roseus TaxID=2601869 RepID=A0A6N6JL72_9RHOB|nr:VPLPA-CTERM sorting domain-containing protein [Litoreibacter roseus]GFE66620.1 hypothetical protein KIN_36940 [Litoreibacter roseus]
MTPLQKTTLAAIAAGFLVTPAVQAAVLNFELNSGIMFDLSERDDRVGDVEPGGEGLDDFETIFDGIGFYDVIGSFNVDTETLQVFGAEVTTPFATYVQTEDATAAPDFVKLISADGMMALEFVNPITAEDINRPEEYANDDFSEQDRFSYDSFFTEIIEFDPTSLRLFGVSDEASQIDTFSVEDTRSVTPVPLPAGLPLLVGAFGLLGVLRHRRA